MELPQNIKPYPVKKVMDAWLLNGSDAVVSWLEGNGFKRIHQKADARLRYDYTVYTGRNMLVECTYCGFSPDGVTIHAHSQQEFLTLRNEWRKDSLLRLPTQKS